MKPLLSDIYVFLVTALMWAFRVFKALCAGVMATTKNGSIKQ